MRPTTTDSFRLIDLHCDTITECHKHSVGLVNHRLQFSLDRIPEGVGICQCMAVFVPDTLRGAAATRYFDDVYATFLRQLQRHRAQLCRLRDTRCIPQALDRRRAVCILTVEGGAVLGGDISVLQKLDRAGVRMMTLTWNGANELCGGADTDEGFTPFGRRVVAAMEHTGMAVDVSHLNDRGFWELCDFASRPFAASHSNARAVCGHRRNLTDDMFREIARRGGVVGLNYYKSFIAEGGKTKSIADLLRHLTHFLELGGEDTVALGSDFDGADMPAYLSGVEKLRSLRTAVEGAGIPQRVVEKLFFHNANRFFSQLESHLCAQGERENKNKG